MFELQQILHDIARKGSDTPFEGHLSRRYRKSIRTKRVHSIPSQQTNAVQLSLFQNR